MNDHFIRSVRAAIPVAGLTLADIRKIVGLKTSGLGYRLTGRSPWRLGEVEDIAAVLGVDPRDMLAGPGPWITDVDEYDVRRRMDAVSAKKADTTAQ
jgi:lambda repressor-like predicted transcriptional regulator